MSIQMKISDLMRDPAVSDWLKAALTATGQRDVNDSLADVELLREICEARMLEVQAFNRSYALLWRHYG